MRPSLGKSCLATLRAIAGLTQGELASLVGVSRAAVQAIELGKLALSPRLAQRISLHTGVSLAWLMAGDYKVPPTFQRDPQFPFTKQIYEMTRAEIAAPRTSVPDLLMRHKSLRINYAKLAAMLLRAHREGKIIYFEHKLRFLLEDLEKEYPAADDFPVADVHPKVTDERLWEMLQAADQFNAKPHAAGSKAAAQQ